MEHSPKSLRLKWEDEGLEASEIDRLLDVADAAKRLSDNLNEFGTITDNCFMERLDAALSALEL